MAINAHYKLQQFLQDHSQVTPRIQRFAKLMSDIVTEIFFVPSGIGFEDVAAQLFTPPLELAHSATGSISPQAAEAADQPPGPGGVDESWGLMEDSEDLEAQELPSESDSRLPGLVVYPEAPDTDGLTDSEFRLVSMKARNPYLDGKQRADAAMMMIFGASRYTDPYLHTAGSVHVG